MTTAIMTHLDYNQIAMRLDAMINDIKASNYEAIVTIVRGGNFPASHLSVRTGLKIYYLHYNRNTGTTSWIGQAPSEKKLLVCEDLAGLGKTLIDCRNFLSKENFEHDALVVFKDTLSASVPEYVCFETSNPNEQFVLPWERFKLNPQSKVEYPKYLGDHEFEITGYDMDGVFLDDVPGEIYKSGLEFALQIRDHYPLATYAPEIQKKDIIITGRPQIDETRSKNWLTEQGIPNDIYFRDDQIDSPETHEVALWKAKKAVELGCSRYIESDPEQAICISNFFHHLEVIWWNKGNPISLKTSKFSI